MQEIPWGNNQNISNEQFDNRTKELTMIKNFLETTSKETPPNLLLTGHRGIGKTVFLKKIKRDMENDYLTIYIHFSQAKNYKKMN